jgi:acyl-CoA thioesterase-2
VAGSVESLIETLDLETLERNLFRGTSPQVGWQRVFGGQVIGQALVAAIRTVDPDRLAHSLHGYFMRPGDPRVPIIYEVARDRDGGSFSTRRVIAIQHGEPIFSMSASFHRPEPGLDHAMTMPNVPAPEALLSEQDLLAASSRHMPQSLKRFLERDRPIELRPCEPAHYLDPKAHASFTQNVWFRARGKLPPDRLLHQCVLAYASDMTLLDTTLVAHGRNIFDAQLMVASLDHALWFHRDFDVGDWLLYAQDTPSASAARGFNRGLIYSRAGQLVASTAQEGLVRIRRDQ